MPDRDGTAKRKTPKGERTRERLLDAGMDLFAQQGFADTTVGEIESAAGLRPRSGAMYKHFESKQALLEAGLERNIERSRAARRTDNWGDVHDLKAELTALARGMLAALQGFKNTTKIIEHDGDSLPELRQRLNSELVQPNYALAADYLRDRIRRLGSRDWDPEALVAVLGGALIGYRRDEWTFEITPLEIGEDEYVRVWVDVAASLLRPTSDSTDANSSAEPAPGEPAPGEAAPPESA